MRRIIVTGGSGKAGRATIAHLLAEGYEVRNVDIAAPPAGSPAAAAPTVIADLTDYGATFAALHGFDAVVHLAADPRPDEDHVTGASRFDNNTISTFNVFQAAAYLGMPRVVWASSETVYGVPFADPGPARLPVTEDAPLRPRSAYAISKVVTEELARQFAQRHGLSLVGLRFSNILGPEDYVHAPSWWADPRARYWNAWSYIDARDAATACRAALHAPVQGAVVCTIAAADSVMTTPNAALVAAVFPNATLDPSTGPNETLLAIDRAKELLGWSPRHSWRETVSPGG